MNNSSIPIEISNIREDISDIKKDNARLRTEVYDIKSSVVELSSVVKVYVDNSNSIHKAVCDIKENIYQMNNPNKEEIEKDILIKQLSDKVDNLEVFRGVSEKEFLKIENNRNILNYVVKHPWLLLLAAAVSLSLMLSLEVPWMKIK
jgi:hypothetical protein